MRRCSRYINFSYGVVIGIISSLARDSTLRSIKICKNYTKTRVNNRSRQSLRRFRLFQLFQTFNSFKKCFVNDTA